MKWLEYVFAAEKFNIQRRNFIAKIEFKRTGSSDDVKKGMQNTTKRIHNERDSKGRRDFALLKPSLERQGELFARKSLRSEF
jgi:hypothetical protein